MEYFRSDPGLATTHLLDSPYYGALDPEEKKMKYPDLSFHGFDETELRRFQDDVCIPVGIPSVNLVRVVDPNIEMGTSWTCASTIFLGVHGNMKHEYCHILQRFFPNLFDEIYLDNGFVHVPQSQSRDVQKMHHGIINPDTFYPDRMDYGYVDPITGDTLISFYNQELEVVTVSLSTRKRVFEPIHIVFMGERQILNHPHEMMADTFARIDCRNFFSVFNKHETAMTTTIPDTQICICTDPDTQENTIVISAPGTDPPSANCKCAMTHEFDHTLFYTSQPQHVRSTSTNTDHLIWTVVWPPVFIALIILGASLFLWFFLNLWRYMAMTDDNESPVRLVRTKRTKKK